jgi:serine protease Do
MKISSTLKNNINKSVVRIIAETINVNWDMPFIYNTPSKGQGTGFFINNKGHILTCAHVVDGAKNLYIEIPNITTDKYECKVIYICPEFDIALIQCLKYKSKYYVKLGDSEKIDSGKEVQVVGYPASLTTSLRNSNNLKFTVGIIGGQQKGLIQTDSAINPGNSGGPLFCNGKVIGINSQKLVGDGIDNVGYSIPINNYKIIKDSFVNNDKTNIIYRPNLLFSFNNTNKNLLKEITNNKIEYGISISYIYDYSPLKNTNIKKGYIITNIGGYDIDNYGYTLNYKWIGTNISIDTLIDKFKENQIISIKYYNIDNNKNETCNIKLTQFIPPIRTIYPAFEKINYLVIGGIIFIDCNNNYITFNSESNISMYCLTTEKEEMLKPKLIVSFILNKKVNILKNIKKNDIITKVNNIDVNSVSDLKKALKKPIIINNEKYINIENKKGKSVTLSIKELQEENKNFSQIYSYPIMNLI